MGSARERLGVLCGQIARHADMEEAIRDAGAGTELDGLLDAARAGKADDPDELTALLDAIEHACARNGLTGITTVTRYTPLPAGSRQRPQPEPPTWICPLRSCERAVFDEETSTPPRCAAAGTRMHPIRLLS